MAHFGSPSVWHEKWMNSVKAVCRGGGLRRRAVKIDKAPSLVVSLQRMLLMFYGRGLALLLKSLPWQQCDGLEIQLVWTGVGGGFSPLRAKIELQQEPAPPPDREGRVSRAKWQTRQCDPIHQREGFMTVLNTVMLSKARDWDVRGANFSPQPFCWSNSSHDTLQQTEFSYSSLYGRSG